MKAEIKSKQVVVNLEIDDRELAALRDLVGSVNSRFGDSYGISSDEWMEMYRTLRTAHDDVRVV